jgi:hypothetical protein
VWFSPSKQTAPFLTASVSSTVSHLLAFHAALEETLAFEELLDWARVISSVFKGGRQLAGTILAVVSHSR